MHSKNPYVSVGDIRGLSIPLHEAGGGPERSGPLFFELLSTALGASHTESARLLPAAYHLLGEHDYSSAPGITVILAEAGIHWASLWAAQSGNHTHYLLDVGLERMQEIISAVYFLNCIRYVGG